MSDAIQFPDRGLAARQMIGRRLIVELDKGRKPHIARVYHVSYRTRERTAGVEGAHVETDCGIALDFIPFDGRLAGDGIGERTAYRVTDSDPPADELCRRCPRSLGPMLLGYSRKRAFRAARPKTPKVYPDTFEGRRQRREDERRNEPFAQGLFNVPYSEVRRRGIVKEGRGRGTRYRLGQADGSEGGAA